MWNREQANHCRLPEIIDDLALVDDAVLFVANVIDMGCKMVKQSDNRLKVDRAVIGQIDRLDRCKAEKNKWDHN